MLPVIFAGHSAGAAAPPSGDWERVTEARCRPDWQRVTELDAGPTAKFKTRDEARAAAATHLDAQEKTLRAYLAAHPADEHSFEAPALRLARLLQIRATFQAAPSGARGSRPSPRSARPHGARRRAHRGRFRPHHLSHAHHAGGRSPRRKQLLTATRAFQVAYPTDRRIPALLARSPRSSIATRKPSAALVLEAQCAAIDPTLKARLGDDLKRIELLGQPISLKAPPRWMGTPSILLEYRGKIVMLVFFGDFSPPSTEALVPGSSARCQAGLQDAVQVIGRQPRLQEPTSPTALRQAAPISHGPYLGWQRLGGAGGPLLGHQSAPDGLAHRPRRPPSLAQRTRKPDRSGPRLTESRRLIVSPSAFRKTAHRPLPKACSEVDRLVPETMR